MISQARKQLSWLLADLTDLLSMRPVALVNDVVVDN